MKVTCYASSSKGNAIQVDNVLIDAGVKVENDFELLLLTHSHIDHIKYLLFSLQKAKSFYTTNDILESLYTKMVKYPKNKYNNIQELIEEKLIEKPTYIETFDLVHDVPCVGYKINDYVHITDTGIFKIPDIIKNQRFYSIESNYDLIELQLSNRHPDLIERIQKTHLSNEQAIQLALDLDAKEVMFVHLSEVTNSIDLAKTTHQLKDNKIIKHYGLSLFEIEV